MYIYSTVSRKQINKISSKFKLNYSNPVCIDDDCDKSRSIPRCGGYINPKHGCCGGTYSKETCYDKDYKLYDRCKTHNACSKKC